MSQKRAALTQGKGKTFKKQKLAPKASMSQVRPQSGYGRNQHPRSGPELKDIDTGPQNSAFNTTGVVTQINPLAQGVDINNRIGNKVVFKSIYIRGAISAGATPTAGAIRTVVVYDKQSNGTAPTMAQMFTATDMTAFNNLQFRDRFVVLKDDTDYIEAAGRSVIPYSAYIRCNLEGLFNSGSSTPQTGSIVVCTFGSNAAGVTAPIMAYTARVRFVDA